MLLNLRALPAKHQVTKVLTKNHVLDVINVITPSGAASAISDDQSVSEKHLLDFVEEE